ncbi:DUF5360 family protein [Leptospira adleri]|uniref:YvaD family protein n=1 Tax=Leptospira adleri TaxID=2023186 RepID=A0A2M9YR00_9LEPT|nr:DUF5360 family protein [Leptospira adleri]PJZ53973.1 hypothetical protein CH380_07400 [Leptospira adleri]PJZ63172.1 hypothetical protein CH376_04725 [Leptospira adleri]
MNNLLPGLFLFTDIGFILYWTITGFGWIPESYLFKDYHDPILMDWNWSFLPLDLLVSFTGFYSLYLRKHKRSQWERVALISLVLTSCSGLQAVAFWSFHRDFDPSWWIPNLYLLLYPLYFIHRLSFVAQPIQERGSGRI